MNDNVKTVRTGAVNSVCASIFLLSLAADEVAKTGIGLLVAVYMAVSLSILCDAFKLFDFAKELGEEKK